MAGAVGRYGRRRWRWLALVAAAAAVAAAVSVVGPVRHVAAYVEVCTSVPAASAVTVACPKLGYRITGQLLMTAASVTGAACGTELCAHASVPTLDCGIVAQCFGKPSCAATSTAEQRFGPVSSPCRGKTYYHVALACTSDDASVAGCIGDVACFASDFLSPAPDAEKFRAAAVRGVLGQGGQHRGKWIYRVAREEEAARLPTSATPCAIDAGRAALGEFGPYLRCNAAAFGGASQPVVTNSTCFKPGLLLLAPDSGNWGDLSASVSFFLDAPTGANAAIGFVVRYAGDDEHHVFAWGGADAAGAGCAGLYGRDGTNAAAAGASASAAARASAYTLLPFNGRREEVGLTNHSESDFAAAPPVGGGATGAARKWEGIRGRMWHTMRITLRTRQTIAFGEQLNAEVTVDRDDPAAPFEGFLPLASFRLPAPPREARFGIYMRGATFYLQDVLVRHGPLYQRTETYNATCGDGLCLRSDNEDCINCPADCPVPCGCGDGFCESDAEVLGCAADCGPNAAFPSVLDGGRPSGWRSSSTLGGCPIATVLRTTFAPPRVAYSNPVVHRDDGLYAGFWPFNSRLEPLADNTRRELHLQHRSAALTASDYWRTADCGFQLLPLGGGYSTTRRRQTGCLATAWTADGSRDLVLRDERTKFGVLPIGACSWSVTLWARVDSDPPATPGAATNGNVLVQWGNPSPARPHQRVALKADYAANQLVVEWGTRRHVRTMNWQDGGVHYVAVVYDSKPSRITMYVDGDNGVPFEPVCGSARARAQLTYGTFVAGRFSGLLDELKVVSLAWPSATVAADGAVGGFTEVVNQTAAASPSGAGGSGPTPPPTPYPTPPPPAEPTPPPPLPAPPASRCTSVVTCKSCLVLAATCQWCYQGADADASPLFGGVCRSRGTPCAGGAPEAFRCSASSTPVAGTPCAAAAGASAQLQRFDNCGVCGGDNSACDTTGAPRISGASATGAAAPPSLRTLRALAALAALLPLALIALL